MVLRFALALLLLIVLLAYVGVHVFVILPLPLWCRWVAVGLVVLPLVLEVVAMSRAMNKLPLNVASCVYNVANKSLIILLYLLLTFVVLDLGRLVHLVPKAWLHHCVGSSVAIVAVLTCVFIYGSWHYHDKKRVEVALSSAGKLTTPTTLVLASDLHVGYHNRRADLAKWVDKINAENPDMVLFAGDIIDFSLRPVMEEKMYEEFRRVKAPMYACLGNHEFYDNLDVAKEFYDKAGIQLLVDTVAVCGDVMIVGRNDRSDPHRQPLKVLMDKVDNSTLQGKYSVVLDHQPYELSEAESCGVDFQFSGHTHRGQVWPISWITDALYEDSWGPLTKGNTFIYVSSGLGIWGAKYRIGTQSEYVVAHIN